MTSTAGTTPTYVLGISGFLGNRASHDAACAVLRDGTMVAMAQEERFSRVKQAGGFPARAMAFCLKQAGIAMEQVAAIGVGTDPHVALQRYFHHRPFLYQVYRLGGKLSQLGGMPYLAMGQPQRIMDQLRASCLAKFGHSDIPLVCVDHQVAHAASAFFCSGWSESTVISWDGGGDGLTAMTFVGRDGALTPLRSFHGNQLNLGLMYQMVSNFLNLSDEGSLMGLASYGRPAGILKRYVDYKHLQMSRDLRQCLNASPHNFFELTSQVLKELGRPRLQHEPVAERHMALAADVQQVIEEVGMRIVRQALAEAGSRSLCLAGGVALNATLNGKLVRSGLVDRLFVQPCAGDGGTALGAAFVAWQSLGRPVPLQRMEHPYWGARYSDEEVEQLLRTVGVAYERLSEDELVEHVPKWLEQQRIIGWFQGAAEWGPRALGARSILADPRSAEMKQRVNEIVKYRDEWRPFAPSLLADVATDYLEACGFSPFMLETYRVRLSRQRDISAVVHVDQTTRPQTVTPAMNPLYYRLIQRFGQRSGVPVLLNTSFNLKGEPLVNSPIDALRCFFSCGLDVLVLQHHVVFKRANGYHG